MMHHPQEQQQQQHQQELQQQQQPIEDNPKGPIFVDTQHDDMVHDAQLDYYGCKLATSSSDRTIKIYDVSGVSYTHTATIQEHEGPVWEVSWAHPKFGVVLASCSFDGSVLLHRERTPGDWIVLSAHRHLFESSVNSVSFAPHEYGLVVAAASSDGHVGILTHHEDDTWDVTKFQDNSLGVNAVSWAPYDLTSEHKKNVLRLVTGGCDNRIRFWTRHDDGGVGRWKEDPDTTLGSGEAHMDWVRDVAWAPSSLTNQTLVASCSEDGTVIVWTNSNDNNTNDDESAVVMQPKLLNRFDAPVWRLSWSVTGNILAVSSGDGDVTLWKQMLDGEWKLMSSVEDVVTKNAESSAPQQPM